MTLIIPGVEVKVVKEVVAPQLAPSGVLGLVGFTEKQPGVGRASSWSRFIELFGPGSACSMPEAGRLAIEGQRGHGCQHQDSGRAGQWDSTHAHRAQCWHLGQWSEGHGDFAPDSGR